MFSSLSAIIVKQEGGEKVKWILSSLFVTVCLLTACTSGQLESQPSPARLSDQPQKRDVPASFFTGSSIVPISAASSFTEVSTWYNDQSILYLQEHDEKSSLHVHHLFTGVTSLFFEIEGWIVDVAPNVDYSLFAIQTINQQNEATLFILDQNGETKMTIEEFGEDYTVYWNPYDQEQFMMMAYLPNWEFDVFLVDANTKETSQIELEQSYVQWLSETNVAYIKWDELEPSYEAPLYQFNVETGEEELWKEHVIAYMSFPDQISLTVSVESVYDLYSIYTFYENQEEIRQIEMPILNTYSEQWWIPFYTYNPEERIFYYLRPKYSGDYFSYNDGYELIAYNVLADSEEQLDVMQSHEPMSISPEGDYLLIGNRFEQLYKIEEQVLVPIWTE